MEDEGIEFEHDFGEWVLPLSDKLVNFFERLFYHIIKSIYIKVIYYSEFRHY